MRSSSDASQQVGAFPSSTGLDPGQHWEQRKADRSHRKIFLGPLQEPSDAASPGVVYVDAGSAQNHD